MSENVFERVCNELERRTAFDRLEARGTVRLALKAAGLESRSVQPDQMRVVLERLLPDELRQRGVEDADGVCRALVDSLAACAASPAPDSPESVFRRLAGG